MPKRYPMSLFVDIGEDMDTVVAIAKDEKGVVVAHLNLGDIRETY